MINYGDKMHKLVINEIITNGTLDSCPRAVYKDGEPANSVFITPKLLSFDIMNNENPMITLRPIAWKSAIKEMLWIWQDQSNDLKLLREKYNIHWWNNWALGDDTIGSCYGYTVRKHNLIDNLLNDIKVNPFGRRHIASLWQEEDFKNPHALKPCAFMIICTPRDMHLDKNVLDMTLVIRSSDFCTAGVINMIQYMALQYMIARHCDMIPGKFNCFIQNAHIYCRHLDAAKELLKRKTIECSPKLVLNPDKHNFYDITYTDFELIDYPLDKIKEINPQMSIFKDEIAI